MFDEEHLNLRLTRLEFPDDWTHKGNGLAFVFPKGGAGAYVSSTVVHRLSPGDVLILDGGERGKISASHGCALVFWSFSLCLEHLFPLFGCSEISLLQEVAKGLEATKFYPASDPLAAECHRLTRKIPAQVDLKHRSQLLRIAGTILTEDFKTASGNHPATDVENHLFRVIFDALSANDLLTFSVGELAARFGCSRRHLSRLFHQYIGSSAAGLIMELRLTKAATLLRDPAAKIMNVAGQCGFKQRARFSTCFKRRFGRSPSQWQNRKVEGQRTARLDADPGCPWRFSGQCPWIRAGLRLHHTTGGMGQPETCASGTPEYVGLGTLSAATKPDPTISL